MCKISLHRWKAYDFKIAPWHYGITMVYTDPSNVDKTVEVWLDGGGTVGNPITIHKRTKEPNQETYEGGPTYVKEYECCKRILEYVETFRNARIIYDPLTCNSNFAFRCMLLACGADV